MCMCIGVDGSKISKMNATKFHQESQSLTTLPNWQTSKSNQTHEYVRYALCVLMAAAPHIILIVCSLSFVDMYRVELRKTCEWLARFEEFNGHSATEYVEIPGQYSGTVQPQVITYTLPFVRRVIEMRV
jgi:hypothetical protein